MSANSSVNETKAHAQASRVGVLLVNLGTPEAPTPGAVRVYLKQFLSDPRVVEIPKFVWWFILNGIILPIRSKASAKKYQSIWMRDGNDAFLGSPLLIYSQAQTKRLQEKLGSDVVVDLAMRYGQPSIQSTLHQMQEKGANRILVLPMYPQYSGTTTASSFDEIFRVLKKWRNQPGLRLIKHYHDHSAYIEALKQKVESYWSKFGRPNFAAGDRLVLSFHGVPKRTLDLGDPYHCECLKTGRLLRESLGLAQDQVIISFQSRFGKAEWLQPYTSSILEKLGRAKTKRLDIFCPGFPADCLETLEEIAIEGEEIFKHAGGQEYHAIPCLNDEEAWIEAIKTIATENLHGWELHPVTTSDLANRQELVEKRRQELLNP